jgi:hypothetical protein
VTTKRFTDEQISFALRQAEAGTPVADVCRAYESEEAGGESHARTARSADPPWSASAPDPVRIAPEHPAGWCGGKFVSAHPSNRPAALVAQRVCIPHGLRTSLRVNAQRTVRAMVGALVDLLRRDRGRRSAGPASNRTLLRRPRATGKGGLPDRAPVCLHESECRFESSNSVRSLAQTRRPLLRGFPLYLQPLICRSSDPV